MAWSDYWAILRRRWILIALVVLLDVLASGYLYHKATHAVGYQACLTLYVADVSSPSMIAAETTSLQATGALLAGETAANFFGDDILDVAQSGRVASYIGARAHANLSGAVSGARKDRTVNLCVANPNSATALAGANALAVAMSRDRARFVGSQMAKRTFVTVISAATVAPVPKSHDLLNLALRLILGVLVALGLALLWDALDPAVRDRRDVEQALGVPVLAEVRS